MEKKLFGKVMINGMEHRIELFEKHDPLDTAMGRADTAHGLIRLEEEMPIDQFQETLLHEVIHLVADHAHVELSEQSVATLSVGLFSAGVRVPVEKDSNGDARRKG